MSEHKRLSKIGRVFQDRLLDLSIMTIMEICIGRNKGNLTILVFVCVKSERILSGFASPIKSWFRG